MDGHFKILLIVGMLYVIFIQGIPDVQAAQTWCDTTLTARKSINITNNKGAVMVKGYTQTINITSSITDFDESTKIFYGSGCIEINRVNETPFGISPLFISFMTQKDIDPLVFDDGYYIYYRPGGFSPDGLNNKSLVYNFSDDFESYINNFDLGVNNTDGWGIGTAGSSPQNNITVFLVRNNISFEGNKSMKITKHPSGGDIYLVRNVSNLENVTVEFYYFSVDPNSYRFENVFFENSTVSQTLKSSTDFTGFNVVSPTIRYDNSTGFQSIGDLKNYTWHFVSLNLNRSKVEFYFDRLLNKSFTPTSNISSFYNILGFAFLDAGGVSTAMEAYIDNVRIKRYENPLPTVVLSQEELSFSFCNPGDNNTAFFFNSFDEEQPTTPLNSTFEIFIQANFNGTIFNSSLSHPSNQTHIICNPIRFFTFNATIIYDGAGYSQRTYYFSNTSFINQSINTTLLLLNDPNSTLVTFSLVDAFNLPQKDNFIKIQRFYVGNGTLKTVQISKTNFDGQSIAYLDLNDVLYSISVIGENGESLDSFEATFITSSSVNIQLESSTSGNVYNIVQNVNGSCSYSNITEILSCAFADPIKVREYCLVVERVVDLSNAPVCNTCQTGKSVVLTCLVGNITGKTFFYTVNVQGSQIPLLSAWLQGLGASPYGLVGLLSGVFLVMVMVFFAKSPSIMIMNAVVAVGLGVAFSLVSVGWEPVFGLAAAGSFIIYILRK